MLVMFFLFRHAFSEVPRLIALKLGHMVGNCLNFIIQVQKFAGALPQKNLGPKTCKILVDFIQPLTLIANISGTAQDISNRKANFSRSIPSAFYKKGLVNFGPLVAEN